MLFNLVHADEKKLGGEKNEPQKKKLTSHVSSPDIGGIPAGISCPGGIPGGMDYQVYN